MERKNKLLLISFILLVATFLRFWHLSERAIFLGDQGRDLLLIRESLLAGKIPLVGPPTSQRINSGPAYFYLIIPPLLLTNFHPLGPIYFFTFLGVLSCFLIFRLCLNLFGLVPALISTLLYAISPLVVQRTLGFWNPVLVPFFSFLIFFSLYQIDKKLFFWFPLLGLFLGIAVQFHPSVYVIFFLVLGWWFYFIFQKKRKNNRKKILKWSALGGFCFLITLFPYLIFQFQNDFTDLRKIIFIFLEKFLINQSQAETGNSFFNQFSDFFSQQFQPLSLSNSLHFNFILGLILVVSPFIFRKKRSIFWHALFSIWLLSGLVILSLYPGTVFPHYASFIWPLSFLILASFLKTLCDYFPRRAVLILGLLGIAIQTPKYFSNFSYTYDLKRTQEAIQVVTKEAKNQPFSLVLLSPYSPSDAHFQYFLTLKGASLKKIDSSLTKFLFLICEVNCPDLKSLEDLKIVDSDCLPDCPPMEQQKIVDLKKWSFLRRTDFPWGAIYIYQRH